MNENFEEQRNALRKYVLGNLDDKVILRQVEAKIMLDDDFAEQLSIAEDELVDDYLDGTLTEPEREQFLQFFLFSPENREKLRFIKNLRQYAANQNAVQEVKRFAGEKSARFDWRKLFSSPTLQFAAIALLVFGVGFGIWRTVFYQSDVERGLAQMEIAYQDARPVEARISRLGFAPLNNTRGADESDAESDSSRRRAEGFLLHAAAENENAVTLHALAKFYLTEKKFDKSNELFERAAKLAPNDAQMQSDWGALLLEMGKKAALAQDGANSLTFFDQSLKHLERAIELDPKLPEPKFNRALCLQTMKAFAEARQAWREYLKIDTNSKWAEEANRNLQSLESQKSKESSAAEIERDFLAAFGQKDDGQAWRLLSRNRELIQEKYLPQRLAISYLKAPSDEKKDLLAALEYVGELEKTRVGDPFAAEIAGFYAALPESKTDLLKQAEASVQNGYQFGRKEEYGKALKEFEFAHGLFIKSGNIWEAKLSEYSIAYYLYNDNQLDRSLAAFQQLADFCRSNDYKWLEQSALHWTAGGFLALRKYTQAKNAYQKSLLIAQNIEDSLAVQKNLNGLANISSSVGQTDMAMFYVQRILDESGAADTSSRQKWRNYYSALKALISAKHYNAAKAFGSEAIHLADESKNPVFTTLSYIGTGSAHIQSGNYPAARDWLNDGYKSAAAMPDEAARKKITAYSVLRLAYLERQSGNYENSLRLYEEAINIYENLELPFYLYEAHKGRLLTNLALGNETEVERQIPVALELVERYRQNILEEQERSSFFDTEQSIYDTAVDYEFGRARYERAYNYAETSNSRSLLDWLQKGAKVSTDGKKIAELPENVNPLTLSEIRERMPEKAQILQYSVLENKVLIWLVSKEKFVVAPTEIKADELRGKIENYLKLLQSKDKTAQTAARQTGRDLYDLLIAPVLDHLDPAQDVCLIPNKILFYLPFAALVSPDGKYFLTQFNLLYAPSANVFLLCTENAQKKTAAGESLLSVGNPAFDRKEFEDLPDLPAAETEARKVASFYKNPQILLGKEATKTAFRASMRNAGIIHFAGHYLVAHNEPLSSSLLLAKNGEQTEKAVLTNSELIGEQLTRVKLVVLSACQTGAESFYNGEGLIGLSRTFLAAGAPLVVASQWKVDSDATAELMNRFHFYRRQENLPTTAALRRAQIEMLDAPDERFREPYYWAAFAVFGGYAQF